MAYVYDSAIAADPVSTTSHTASMPVHATNDLLLWLVAKGSQSTSFTTPSGYTKINENISATGTEIGTVAFWKVAASSSEAAPSVGSFSDRYASIMLCIKGAPTTSPIDTQATTQSASGPAAPTGHSLSSPSITTGTNECLCIQYAGGQTYSNSQSLSYKVDSNVVAINGVAASGGASGCAIAAGHNWRQTSGGAPTLAQWFVGYNATNLKTSTIAIKNKTTGQAIPSRFDTSTNDVKQIFDNNDIYGIDGVTPIVTRTIMTINGKTVDNATGSGADWEQSPIYPGFSSIITRATSASVNFRGNTMTKTTFPSLVGKFFVGTTATTIRTSTTELGSTSNMGIVLAIKDSSSNWLAFHIFANDSIESLTDGRQVFSIQPQATTAIDSSGTTSLSSIAEIQMNTYNPVKISAYVDVWWGDFHAIGKLGLCGGDATAPLDLVQFIKVAGAGVRTRVVKKLGDSGALCYVPIQIGGNDAVYYKPGLGSTQFPSIYNASQRRLNVHSVGDDMSFVIYGKSGDTIILDNHSYITPNNQLWKIHASSTSSATWSLANFSIIGPWLITLQDVATYSKVSFIGCRTITLSSCTLNNCSISNTASTVAMNIASVAECAKLTNMSFSSNTAGHSIALTGSPGTYAFNNFNFSGGGSAGTLTADVYNNTGGAVIISVTGGGNTPTIKNGTGASTTVQNSVTVTVTVKDSAGSPIQNARVLLEETGGADIITGLTNVSGVATASYSGTYPQTVQGWVRKSSGSPYYKQGTLSGSVTTSGYDATVVLVLDE